MIEKAFESIVEFITKTYSIETFYVYLMFLLVKSRLLCKMLYNVFTISTYQN